MDRSLSAFPSNCALLAIQVITGCHDGEVLDACVANGFKGKGMNIFGALKAIELLGFKYESITVRDSLKTEERYLRNNKIRKIEYEMKGHRYRPNKYHVFYSDCPTIRQFAEQFNTGAYYVRVQGHALAVIDGKIIDKNFSNRKGGTRLKMKVHSAHKVERSV